MSNQVVYNENSATGMLSLPRASVDLIITSPPYADIKKYGDVQPVSPDNYVEWFRQFYGGISHCLKTEGSVIINIDDKVQDGFRHPYVFQLVCDIIQNTELKLYEKMFWNKLKGLPQTRRFTNRVEFLLWFAKTKPVYNIDNFRVPYSDGAKLRLKNPIRERYARSTENQDGGITKPWVENPLGALPNTLISISSEARRVSDNHFAVFPEKLVEYFIKGLQPSVVVDPFAGSGTTGVVCKKHNIEFIGFDVNSDYVVAANKRISEV